MSILKTIPISLDLKRVGAQSQALPTLIEGDNGNVFVIQLTDDGAPLDLSAATKVICVFSKTSDGRTVEQDTEDANVALSDYGIEVTGTPDPNDTVTITNNAGTVTASVSGTGVTGATVDESAFLEKFPDEGSYVFKFGGASWQYGDHSVVIGGDDNDTVTVKLKTASFGAGTNNCEVQIYSGTGGDVLVTTANFNFRGRKGIMNDETLLSEEKYPVLVSLISQVTAALQKAMPFTSPSASASTLSPGSSATANAVVGEDSIEFQFGIPQGETGNGIASVAKLSISGLTDTYKIMFTDGTSTNFYVNNGRGISQITHYSAGDTGTERCYKVDYNDGLNPDYLYVQKGDKGDQGIQGVQGETGNGIASIALISGDHSAGTSDTYRITMTDGSYFDFPVYNGQNGQGLVQSVNGQTGAVVLEGDDIRSTYYDDDDPGRTDTVDDILNMLGGSLGTLANRTINGNRLADGNITLSASDVGAATPASVTNITEMKFTSFSGQSWTASSKHSSDTAGTYPYRYSIPCSGVTAAMYAEVTFGVASAVSGIYSPICQCYAGGVYIWAKSQTAPTILSILVHK